MKIIDDMPGRKHDVWCSEIDVKIDKKAAKDLLKKFKNPKPKESKI